MGWAVFKRQMEKLNDEIEERNAGKEYQSESRLRVVKLSKTNKKSKLQTLYQLKMLRRKFLKLSTTADDFVNNIQSQRSTAFPQLMRRFSLRFFLNYELNSTRGRPYR